MKTYDQYKAHYGRGISRIDENNIVQITRYSVSYAMQFKDGWKKHRLDGPSTIFTGPEQTWYFYGKCVAEFGYHKSTGYQKTSWQGPFYDWTVEQGMDIDNLSEDDKQLIKMVWA